MPEYLPVGKPGQANTYTAGAAITGGRVVEPTASLTVAQTGTTSSSVVGVAGNDANSGERVLVHTGGVHALTAAATITAGQTVEATTNGQVTPHTNGTNDHRTIGLALTGASAGGTARVQLLR